MKLKSVAKLIGAGVTAGITGGFLALKMRQPRRTYADFLRVYASLSVDFVRRLEYTFVETMVPEVVAEDRSALEDLLDRQATFNEKMRFFQKRVATFDELVLKALTRFYNSRGSGLGGSSLEGKVIEFSGEAAHKGVVQLFAHLEESFELALAANLPPGRGGEMRAFVDKNPSAGLVDRLQFYQKTFPGFGSVLFDAISRFEAKVYNISLP